MLFLAETAGGAPLQRTCTSPIPAGKKIFFPLLNALYYNDLADPQPYPDVNQKRAALGDYISNICSLNATLDGTNILFSQVGITHVQSPPFHIQVGNYDVWGATPGSSDDQAISEGYWGVLSLAKGQHTLHVQAALCDQTTHQPFFQTDYTYVMQIM